MTAVVAVIRRFRLTGPIASTWSEPRVRDVTRPVHFLASFHSTRLQRPLWPLELIVEERNQSKHTELFRVRVAGRGQSPSRALDRGRS